MTTSQNCRWFKFGIALLGLCLGLSAVPIPAQLPTGTILGTVRDTSGAVIAGATVTARNQDIGLTRTITTGSDGSYRIPALPVGNYQVDVTHEGFKEETLTGLTITVAQEAVVNIILAVGTTSQTIEVFGEVALVDTTSSTLGGLVNEQKVEQLPLNGRNFLDLAFLQTGILNGSSTENTKRGVGGDIFSSNGAPTRSNNYMLDGAIMQNLYGMNPASVAQTELGLDGIKEYKTITSLFSAEYGMTMGSQTTIVSKGGTNLFHGDVFEFLRNNALDARNPEDFGYLGGGPRLPPFQQNQFGGAFGGPIKKNKTFVYGVYEGFRSNLGLSIVQPVPGAGCHGAANAVITSNSTGPCPEIGDPSNPTQTFSVTVNPIIAPFLALLPTPTPGLGSDLYTFPASQRTREDFGQMRVDENFSNSDSFFVRYTVDDTIQTKPDDYPQDQASLTSRSQYLTLSENHIFSSAVINTFRASYSRTGFVNNSVNSVSIPLLSNGLSGGIDISGALGGTFGPESTTGFIRQNIYTWSDDIFWTKGKHALKFGTLINRYGQGIQDNNFIAAEVPFASMTDFLNGIAKGYTFTPPTAIANRNYVFDTLGFYAQDDVRLKPRLTVNLGLRYEFNTTPHETNGRGSAFLHFPTDHNSTVGPIIQNSSLKNFSPRIGLAWDVFGNGKTSVRSGFGMYYDIANLGSALQQDSTAKPPFSYQGGSNVKLPLCLPLDTCFPVPITGPTAFQNATIANVDYYVKQPYTLQYNLSIGQQLPFDTALNVSYVGSRGIHLWNLLEGNPAVPTSTINGNMFWDPFAANYSRINPFFNDDTLFTTRGDSYYNSLQVELTKRLTRGLQFQSSYTYGKLIDDGQGQLPVRDAGTNFATDPYNPRTDKGPSELDATNQWKFNLLYHFPNLKSQGFVSKIANGWWMGNIVSVVSGFAYSPVLTFYQANSLINQVDRPDIVTSANVTAVQNGTYMRDGILGGQNPNAVPYSSGTFNPNMFIPGPPGLLGNAPRGILRGPGLRNWDFSLSKDTKLPFLGEAGNLEFRAEFFNVLNHANFGLPDNSSYVQGPFFSSEGVVCATVACGGNTVQSSTAGQITSTATPPRQIQFGLKVEF